MWGITSHTNEVIWWPKRFFAEASAYFWGVAAESAATVIPMIARLWQGLWEDSCQMRSLARIWWERRLRRHLGSIVLPPSRHHQEVSPFNRKWTLIYNRHFLNVRHEEFPLQRIKVQEIKQILVWTSELWEFEFSRAFSYATQIRNLFWNSCWQSARKLKLSQFWSLFNSLLDFLCFNV